MKKNVLWLEDRPESIASCASACEMLGYNIEIVSTLVQFAERIDEYDPRNKELDLACIVLDVLVYGALDLSIFSMEIDTNQGLDAGWAVLEHILSESKYSKIPVLIFTSREISKANINLISKLNKHRTGHIFFIEKSSTQNEILEWFRVMKNE